MREYSCVLFRSDALPVAPPPGCGEALEALAELAAMAQPSSGADAAGELEEALDEATYWAGKLFDQCRAAAAALAWLPQSLAADPVPTLRDPIGRASCRDRVLESVENTGVAWTLKKHTTQ